MDFSEIDKLASDLASAPTDALPFIDKAIKYTATELKNDWQQGATRTGLESYAASIDYDMRYGVGEIAAEIGPNLSKRQGMFGMVEDANGDVRSRPQHAGRDAMRANTSDFERGLEIAIFDATQKAVGG